MLKIHDNIYQMKLIEWECDRKKQLHVTKHNFELVWVAHVPYQRTIFVSIDGNSREKTVRVREK